MRIGQWMWSCRFTFWCLICFRPWLIIYLFPIPWNSTYPMQVGGYYLLCYYILFCTKQQQRCGIFSMIITSDAVPKNGDGKLLYYKSWPYIWPLNGYDWKIFKNRSNHSQIDLLWPDCLLGYGHDVLVVLHVIILHVQVIEDMRCMKQMSHNQMLSVQHWKARKGLGIRWGYTCAHPSSHD